MTLFSHNQNTGNKLQVLFTMPALHLLAQLHSLTALSLVLNNSAWRKGKKSAINLPKCLTVIIQQCYYDSLYAEGNKKPVMRL